MMVKGSNNRFSKNARMSIVSSKCDMNAFTFEDNACLEANDGYSHTLCLNELFDESSLDFEVYSEVCKNGKPVYWFTDSEDEDGDEIEVDDVEINEDNIADVDFDNLVEPASDNVNSRYFLHFSADNHWIISLNEISDVYKAVCHEDNLMDCTVNKWAVLNSTMVEYEEVINENITSSAVDYIEELVEIKAIAVAQNECGYEAEAVEKEPAVGTTGVIAIIAVIAIVLLALVFGFLLYKWANEEGRAWISKGYRAGS